MDPGVDAAVLLRRAVRAGPEACARAVALLAGDGEGGPGSWGAGPRAERVRPLCALLEHADWRVRHLAAIALGGIGDPAAVEPLAHALRGADLQLRRLAASSLAAIGRPALPALCRVLERCDWDARSRAAEALGRIGDPRALAWFVAGLRHPHEVVRLHCTRAIAALGDPRGVEPLCVALGDARASVRRRAALALARLDDPRAPPALAAALRDGDPDVRRFAAEGLIRLGWEPPTWRDAVLLALCSGRSELPGPACAGRVAALCEIVREGDWELRGAAARALTRLAREEPAPELRLALPTLRRVLRWWPADGEEALALLQQAARSIEAATECGKELPRPALAPAPAADALPRPAPGAPDGSKEHAPEQLPVPSAAPRETAIRPRRHRAGRARARMKWGRAAVTCFLQGGWL